MRLAPTTIALCVLSATLPAAPQSGNAQSAGMGGTGVASAEYWNAAFNNPALLTHFDEGDDLAIVLPSFGMLASDPDSMVDTVEGFDELFADIDAEYEGGGAPTQENLDALAAALEDLDNRHLTLGVDSGLSVSIPSKSLGLSIFVRGYLDARGFVLIDQADVDAIENAIDDPELPELASDALLSGASVTEYGVALAREFELAGRKFSIGIVPKMQAINTINYVVSADEFDDRDSDDYDDDQYQSDDSAFNLDLGLSTALTDSLMLGVKVNNVLSRELDSALVSTRQFTYSLDPVITAGAAWTSGPLTLAADLDLVEREPFDFVEGSQYAGVGAELAWRWAQLRAGLRTDLAGEATDVLTAGIGFSPFGVMRLDLAGMVGDDTYGAALQATFSF